MLGRFSQEKLFQQRGSQAMENQFLNIGEEILRGQTEEGCSGGLGQEAFCHRKKTVQYRHLSLSSSCQWAPEVRSG